MTKKDFDFIAGIIRDMTGKRYSRKQIAEVFCRDLNYSFDRFNPSKFMAACEVEKKRSRIAD